MTLLIFVIVIQYLVFSWICAGMFFADAQLRLPESADEQRLDDLGHAVLLGLLYGLSSIFGVFMALCLSRFAQHGLWNCGGSMLGKKIWEAK